MKVLSISNCLKKSLAIFALLLPISAQAVEVVRIQIVYNNTNHTMDIELFDDIAPLTVANYLDYVTSLDTTDNLPKFDGTFVYRNVSGYILQMGGYTFRPPEPSTDALISLTAADPVGLVNVPIGDLSPVINEFTGTPNTRGTISMAKVPASFIEDGCLEVGTGCTLVAGTGPDSASQEWFINLNDNSHLDSINGGFTVFGKIIDNGLNIADEISSFPDRLFAGAVLGPEFNNLPVANDYNNATFEAVLQKHLIMLTTFKNITRPILRLSSDIVDFKLDVANDVNSAQLSAVLTNTGNEALIIDTIDSTGLPLPFSISSEDCLNNTLTINAALTCSINIDYAPTALGVHTGEITVGYTGPDNTPYSVSFKVTGEGVAQEAALSPSADSVAFDSTSRNTSSDVSTLSLENRGGNSLTISGITISGTDSADFISSHNCQASLAIAESCDVNLTFNPAIEGEKTATLTLVSNGGNIDIALSGLATIPPIISADISVEIKAPINEPKSRFINVSNNGTEDLVLSNASFSGADAALFSQENSCPDINSAAIESLAPGGTCRFLIKFSPVAEGSRSAVLTIESNDPDSPSIVVAVSGIIAKPVITVDSTFDLGTIDVNSSTAAQELIVSNTGNWPLNITDITGLNNTNFSQTNTCIGTDPIINILASETCSIFIIFSPDFFGTQNVDMLITSNDPDSPSSSVNLTGFGDIDTDGDGISDNLDDFPLDANESIDTDLDTIGNNADTDDDGDGVADIDDAFPLDASKSAAEVVAKSDGGGGGGGSLNPWFLSLAFMSTLIRRLRRNK